MNYILDKDGLPVVEPDLHAWALWYENSNRSLAKTEIGKATVSTVFLAIDHGFGSAEPVLWETLVFGALDEQMERYSTREAALEGHEEMCSRIREAM